LVFVAATDRAEWPEIASLRKSFSFSSASNASAAVTILGKDGTPHLLECHTYEHETDPEFDYSGDLECRLKSLYSEDTYPTLLTEERKPTRDWQSRGRVMVEDLEGSCADHPEWGRIRSFDLRGMKLTLSLSDVAIVPGGVGPIGRTLGSFSFEVSAAPNPAAKSSIAARTPYEEPPRAHPERTNDFTKACERVIRRENQHGQSPSSR
jgi:hypothetical protein